MLQNKTGIIFGVANKRSIAWAAAQALHGAGARLAFTYQGERLKENVEELTKSMPDSLVLPGTNLRIGFNYLKKLIDRYEGDEGLALTAYNRGPGTVDRILKRGGDPDNGYADAVISGEGVHR